ncbi:MAG: hypothetical protein HQ582_22910, partial [Planctomycetes bacterium]|nr:hypothetical protein [Planctomycetota bacterium]
SDLLAWIDRCRQAESSWQAERDELQERMSKAGAHIRSADELRRAVEEAWRQFERIESSGCRYAGADDLPEAFRNRHLCFAHAVYLEAVLFALESGVGSRGSAMVVDPEGARVHDQLGDAWRIAAEDTAFRDKVQETLVHAGGKVGHRWVQRRPLPESDIWFETAWARFRNGDIYRT